MADWNALIRDVIAGEWRDPETGKAALMPFETIRLEEDLDGGAADVVAPLKLGKRLAVVSDVNTHEAMGRRVAKELKALGTIDEIVMPGNTHCDEPTIAEMQEKTRHADGVVVVGSGSLSDVVKYATFKDGRRYASFPTAASMNGYAAGTASVTLASQPKRRAVFLLISKSMRQLRPGCLLRALATVCAGPRRRLIGGPRTGCLARLIRKHLITFCAKMSPV
jgi:glycerol-1-phosphate dehydrogenase [NAD(P)+]